MRLLSLLLLFAAPTLFAAPSLDAIKAHIAHWEGFSLAPYNRSIKGVVVETSVGYGHNLRAHGEPIRLYTQEEVDAFFARDVEDALRACRHIKDFDRLPDQVQLCCIGIAFSTGPTGFSKWKGLRRALNGRLYELAGYEIASSVWARQVGQTRMRAYFDVVSQGDKP